MHRDRRCVVIWQMAAAAQAGKRHATVQVARGAAQRRQEQEGLGLERLQLSQGPATQELPGASASSSA